ncbi:MAG: hypothetical protein ACRCU2_00875 [Planktothrix sp.]
MGGQTPYVISQQNPQEWGYTDEARLRGLIEKYRLETTGFAIMGYFWSAFAEFVRQHKHLAR